MTSPGTSDRQLSRKPARIAFFASLNQLVGFLLRETSKTCRQLLLELCPSIHPYAAKCNSKVIATLVIRPLDDRTYCARVALTHLRLWQRLYQAYHSSRHHFTASNVCSRVCLIGIFVDLQQFDCNLKGWRFRCPDLMHRRDARGRR